MDSDGNLKYKEHLIKDLRQVILPALIEKNGYIPIPRIEYTGQYSSRRRRHDADLLLDDMIDVVIENLTLQSANLLPNVVEIGESFRLIVAPKIRRHQDSSSLMFVGFRHSKSLQGLAVRSYQGPVEAFVHFRLLRVRLLLRSSRDNFYLGQFSNLVQSFDSLHSVMDWLRLTGSGGLALHGTRLVPSIDLHCSVY